MKKTNLIIIIIVAIVLIGAGAFFLMKGKSSDNTSQKNASEQNSPASAVKQGLLGLLENASGIKCSVSDQTGSYTVIAKGEKAKIEGISFANPSNPTQKDSKGTMINDGTWAYIWNGKEGMKFNLKDTQQTSSSAVNTEEKSTDWKGWAEEMQDSGAKYDCNPTVATDADFTPPSDVKFQDLAELMKSFQNIPNNVQIPPIPTP